MRSNRRWVNILVLLVVYSGFILLFPSRCCYGQQQYQQQACADINIDPSNAKYEWETWNSYEILGLEDPPPSSSSSNKQKKSNKSSSSSSLSKKQAQRQKFDSKEIRKAYRKQAQLWHPDKIGAATTTATTKTNSNSTTTEDKKKKKEKRKSKSKATRPTNISVEESNARFAKIAEAYSILSDTKSKEEYDNYLKYCEDEKRRAQQKGSNDDYEDWTSSFMSKFNTVKQKMKNPFDLFEELVFGNSNQKGNRGSTYYDDDDEYMFYDSYFFDPESDFMNDGSYHRRQSGDGRGYYSSNSYYRQPEQPSRTYESQSIIHDMYSGKEYIRVCETEEYYTTSSGGGGNRQQQQGRMYYRVIAQDYAQVYDPYERSRILQPISSQPYLLDEGWTTVSAAAGRKFSSYSDYGNRNRRGQQQFYSTSSPSSSQSNSILPGMVVTPDDSIVLRSPNGRYYAGLSSECQLLVFSRISDLYNYYFDYDYRGNADDEEELIWRSPLLIPYYQIQQRQRKQRVDCFATLKDGHFIIAGGTSPDHVTNLLWYSHPDPRGSSSGSSRRGSRYEFPRGGESSLGPTYTVQLDDDGSLVVYRIEIMISAAATKAKTTTKTSYFNGDIDDWASSILGFVFGEDGMNVDDIQHIDLPEMINTAIRNAFFRTKERHLNSKQFVVYKTCVHATGPMGCNRPARRLFQLVRDVRYNLLLVWKTIDHTMDRVLLWLAQDADDDDDGYGGFRSNYYHHQSSNSKNVVDRMWRKLKKIRQNAQMLRERFNFNHRFS